MSRPRDESGAIAIIVAALTLVLFAIAALGVDVASQVQRKHLLKNQLDAAATAAAFHLDQGTNAIRDAVTNAQDYFAKNGEGTLDVSKVDFWCVVSRKSNADGTPATPAQVATYQIPSRTSGAGVCNPDAATATTDWKMSDYQNRLRYDGQVFKMTCSSSLCAVPCALNASPANNWSPGNSIANSLPITCNTIRVGAEQNVPFSFAPAIGIDEGSTGSQVAVACKGSCGEISPNPMNVVVVTDRTASMSDTNLRALVQGVKDMLGVMSPDVQFVSLATIGRSKETNRSNYENCTSGNTGSVAYYDGSDNSNSSKAGFWVPMKFYKDYLTSGAALNTGSNLVKALTCITTVGKNAGTYLASPLKAAARFSLGLTGTDTTGWNVNSELNGASRSGRLRNVVIFETDGQPYEPATTSCGSASLTAIVTGCGNGYDLFSPTNKYEESSTTADTSTSTNTCPSGTVPYSGAAVCATSYPKITCQTGDTLGTSGSFAGKCWRLKTSGTSYNSQTKCQNAGYSWGRPTGSGTSYCWQDTTPTTYTIGYKTTVNTKTTTNTRSLVGGQDACKNFQNVANSFKSYSEDTLLITISYNLGQDGQTPWCSGQNRTPDGDVIGTGNTQTTDSSTTQGTPYLSGILNSSGSSVASACKANGSGTAASPYVFNASATLCKQNVTLVYTRNDTVSQSLYVNNARDQKITDVLAGAAGGQGIDPSTANNTCFSDADRASENGDGDFYFCAASGDALGPVFITALSQISSGIRLINLP
jgi:hypothetical protein